MADDVEVKEPETKEPAAKSAPGPSPQVATTWYAPNQQCVHADTLGPAQVHATGANAGVPGAWTPAGSDPPNTVAELQAGYPLTITANPATNWTVGQNIVCGNGATANWNGTAWVAGVHA